MPPRCIKWHGAAIGIGIDKYRIAIAIRRRCLISNQHIGLIWIPNQGNVRINFSERIPTKSITFASNLNQPTCIGLRCGAVWITTGIGCLCPIEAIDSIRRIVRIVNKVWIRKWCAILLCQISGFVWNTIVRHLRGEVRV